jgi:ribosomal protein S18 acetylase RimI-like enzyme
VTQVCLLPEYRRHRIGENLLASTYNSLRTRNFNLLSLTVTEMNQNAVALYKRLGFVETSVFDAFVWEG